MAFSLLSFRILKINRELFNLELERKITMSEKTVGKEFETLKKDLVHLIETFTDSLKEKLEDTRDRGERVAEEVKEKIEDHPKTSMLIGASVMFGLGILAAKLWNGRDRR